MDNFTLRQLRYFDAVAHYQHFGDAASACSVSQPALSMQIKMLEETLQTSLFERKARRVRLTAEGERFRTKVTPLLQAADALSDWTHPQSKANVERLRLGIIPTIAPYLLPQIIPPIRREFQGINLQIRETMTMPLLIELREKRLDAAILALPLVENEFHEEPILDEEFVMIRPKTEADAPLPARDQLKEMRWLLLEDGHCFRDQALAVCHLDASEPREVLDGSSLTTLVQMVAAGMGVTLLPEMAVPLETRKADVAISRFDAPAPKRSIGMVWRKNTPMRAELMRIAEILRGV